MAPADPDRVTPTLSDKTRVFAPLPWARHPGGECRVLSSDQQVALEHGERFVYPDATVVCSRVQLVDGGDALLNPSAVIEVLSPSTERYDRGKKWAAYQRLESLRDYVIVSQREPRIEHFRRKPDGEWSYVAAGPGERVTLAIGVSLEVDAVYEGVFELRGDEDDARPA
jgi:Uma2 family endonuclease